MRQLDKERKKKKETQEKVDLEDLVSEKKPEIVNDELVVSPNFALIVCLNFIHMCQQNETIIHFSHLYMVIAFLF